MNEPQVSIPNPTNFVRSFLFKHRFMNNNIFQKVARAKLIEKNSANEKYCNLLICSCVLLIICILFNKFIGN